MSNWADEYITLLEDCEHRSDDTRVLMGTIRMLSLALDELVGACMDEAGKVIAPPRAELTRARGLLPPYCNHAFKKHADPNKLPRPMVINVATGGMRPATPEEAADYEARGIHRITT